MDISVEKGFTVGALAAVNSFGSVTMPGLPDFWAWPFERNAEYGGRGVPKVFFEKSENSERNKIKEIVLDFDFESTFKNTETSYGNDTFVSRVSTNTTLCIVAADAKLTKSQA